jgi:hypothetical protein
VMTVTRLFCYVVIVMRCDDCDLLSMRLMTAMRCSDCACDGLVNI